MAEQSNQIKYPNVKVKLIGRNGNAFFIMGTVQRALRDAGAPDDDIKAYVEESQSGDYGHLLRTAMRWVNVC